MGRETRIRSDIVYLTILVLAAALIANPSIVGWRSDPGTIEVTKRSDPGRQDIKVVAIDYESDRQKAGTAFGALSYHEFTQSPATHGRSVDELRFVFDRPARVLGVLISVDIGQLTLVEFAVGIDNSPGYGSSREANWLLHVSYRAEPGQVGSIDEHVILPDGFEVEPGQFIGVGAWLNNGRSTVSSVFPEILIYYEWIDG
jgi:hypothetical protein